MRVYKENYPEKEKAKSTAAKLPCPVGYERHHWSYNEPHYKDVIIMHQKDHAKIHKYLFYDKRLKMYRTLDGTVLDTRDKHEKYIEIVKQIF